MIDFASLQKYIRQKETKLTDVRSLGILYTLVGIILLIIGILK